MSTKKETTQNQATQFDPQSMGAYHALLPQIQGSLGDFMSKPWESGFFQNALNRGYESIGNQSAAARRNILNPAFGANVSNPSAFMASQLGKISRGVSRQKSDLLTNLLLGSGQMRMQATQGAQAFNPLTTGQSMKSIEKSGGLGSWLPQLIGSLGGAAMGAMTGGASSAFGSMGANNFNRGATSMLPYGSNWGGPSAFGGIQRQPWSL